MNTMYDDDDFASGDRMVVTKGQFAGTAGVLLGIDIGHSYALGFDVYRVLTDDGDTLIGMEELMEKSIYQNEDLEAVPNV